MNNDRNGSNAGAVILIAIPLLFCGGLFAGLAYNAAKIGKSYRTVRRILTPATYLISLFFGGLAFVFFGWFIAFFTNSTGMANYVIGKVTELSMVTFLFGDPRTIPIWHIILYQVILWLTFGRRLTRHLAISIYDYALISVGRQRNEHPYYVRQSVLKYDPDFAEADAIYMKRRKPATLGYILVYWFSQVPPEEYFHDYGSPR